MKPRSPLPWKRQLLPDGTFQYQDANMEPVIDDDCFPLADVPYVIHACNAYPKLVEIVIELREHTTSDHAYVYSGKILKELGEL